MGDQILLQPDGLLAVFSTVSGRIEVADATPAELEEHYAERAAARSREDTRRLLHAVLSGEAHRVYYRFALTYAEAVSEHLEGRGDERYVCRPKQSRQRGKRWK